MKKPKSLLFILTLALLFGCNRSEQEVPAFLSIDAIVLDRGNDEQWNREESGFFTYLIDGVNIEYWRYTDAERTQLGTFQLPCRIPVLDSGMFDTMVILPVVKQNGVAATRINYIFYKEIGIGKRSFEPGQTLELGTLHTTYKSSKTVHVPWREYFNPMANCKLDSVVRYVTHPDTVRSNDACGVIRVADTMKSISFWSRDSIHISPATAGTYLYLEMDYWTDFDLSVALKNPRLQGGQDEVNGVMVLYRNKGWQKIYINLGRTWDWCRYYPDIRLYFTVLNDEGRAGNVYLDNLKVIYM